MSAPDPRRWAVWPWVALVAAGLLTATAAAFISDSTSPAASAVPVATQSPQTITETVTRSVTVTVTVSPPPPADPAVEFGDGSYVVGVDVAPGVYRTAGPDGTNGGGCYWSQRKPDSSSITDYGVVNGPGRITLRGGELVEVNGCQPWTRS